MTFEHIYGCQDVVLRKVFEKEETLFPGAVVILAGGTALSRCYLNHRLSHDLDFFIDRGFDPYLLKARLNKEGINIEEAQAVSDPLYAAQLHGQVKVEEDNLSVSFVEDVHAGTFPMRMVGDIRTETIEGLYHRKLRTITGSDETKDETGRLILRGARQTARDLFDIYVLSNEVMPVMDFIMDINSHGASLPELSFLSGIRRMPWLDLMDEFEILEVAERYKGITAFNIKRYFDESLKVV